MADAAMFSFAFMSKCVLHCGPLHGLAYIREADMLFLTVSGPKHVFQRK